MIPVPLIDAVELRVPPWSEKTIVNTEVEEVAATGVKARVKVQLDPLVRVPLELQLPPVFENGEESPRPASARDPKVAVEPPVFERVKTEVLTVEMTLLPWS